MANLDNKTPAETYKDLLLLDNQNQGLDSDLSNVCSGSGVNTGIQISTTQVNIDFSDGKATKPVVVNGLDSIRDLGSVTAIESPVGTVNIDLSLAQEYKILLNSNITSLNFGGLPVATSSTDGKTRRIRLYITQGSTASTLNWPASIKWAGGLAPVISTGSGDIDIVDLIYTDDGSAQTWFGVVIGQAFA